MSNTITITMSKLHGLRSAVPLVVGVLVRHTLNPSPTPTPDAKASSPLLLASSLLAGGGTHLGGGAHAWRIVRPQLPRTGCVRCMHCMTLAQAVTASCSAHNLPCNLPAAASGGGGRIDQMPTGAFGGCWSIDRHPSSPPSCPTTAAITQPDAAQRPWFVGGDFHAQQCAKKLLRHPSSRRRRLLACGSTS